jgi:hypothetical protein
MKLDMPLNIVDIFGGLGNQLFQYSFGRYIQVKTGIPTKFAFSQHKSTIYREPLILQLLDDIPVANAQDTNRIMRIGKRYILENIMKKLMHGESAFTEKREYEENYSSGNFYVGYWQHDKYVVPIIPEMRTKIFASRHKQYNIKNSQNRKVAIHVRRGDYIENQTANDFHGVCEIDYFERAIAYFNNISREFFFLIFSDDPGWCKEEFGFRENYYFFDDRNRSTIDDFVDMAMCDHFIVSNSTFSWWAAILSSHEDKILIRPKKWFRFAPDPPIFNLHPWIEI